MERPYTKIKITPKGERKLRDGHPWVFADEVTELCGEVENGGIVDVYSQKDRWLGAGFYNDASKIRVRLISRNTNDRFDERFWRRALAYAVDYRRSVMSPEDFRCCRLIFGEDFTQKVYRHTPAQTAAWLTEQLARLLPDRGTAEITKLIGA